MKKYAYNIVFVLGLLIGFGVSEYIKASKPVVRTVEQIKSVFHYDTVTVMQPVNHVRYIREIKLDTVEIIKPVLLRGYNIAPLNAISRADDHLVYTYFNPRDLRYEQQEYSISKSFS